MSNISVFLVKERKKRKQNNMKKKQEEKLKTQVAVVLAPVENIHLLGRILSRNSRNLTFSSSITTSGS